MSKKERDPLWALVMVLLAGVAVIVWTWIDYDSFINAVPDKPHQLHGYLFKNLDFIGGKPLVICIGLLLIYLSIKEIINRNRD